MKRFIYILFLLSIHYSSFSQCEADFTVMSDNSDYQFINASTLASGDEIESQLWQFGDGLTSLQTDPVHSYTVAGIYEVKLEINTVDGCSSKDSMLVEVCEIDLDFNLSAVCNNDGDVALILNINDVFNALDSVKIIVDDIALSDSVMAILNGELDVILSIPGDGGQHFITVESLPNAFCSQTVSFLVQDCNASCFLSDLSIDEGYQETHNIALLEEEFVPSNRIITLGDRVRFIWFDDQHTSTSEDIVSSDQWDSGVQDSSYMLELFFKNPGIKPYYSSIDGGPQDDYSGNIIAECPETRGSTIGISFINASVPPEGFHIGIDGVVLKDTVYQYSTVGFTEIEFFLAGDGESHQISIIDVADETCSLKQTIKAINCQGDFECALNVNAIIEERCDQDSMVTVAINVSSLNPSDNGVLIILDDTLLMDTIYFENELAKISIPVFGDGLTHMITAIDLTDSTCMDVTPIRVNDCGAPCSIENLEIGTGSNSTVVLGVIEDKVTIDDIILSSGDEILWQWLQDSLIGLRSYEESGLNSWDSGLMSNGGIFISPILTVGNHPYFLYNSDGDTLFDASIEIIASCEDNMFPVFYSFTDVNGAEAGYDIYVDSIRLENGPFSYKLDGNNRGFFQLEGDDSEHLIEIRDLGSAECYSGSIFIAPTCEEFPCGGMITLEVQDSCYNDNTVRYLATVSHPEPSVQGFIFRINGQLLDGFPFLYGPDGQTTFDGNLLADSSAYVFTYVDLEDPDCIDTLIYQSDICVTDCVIDYISTSVMDSSYLEQYPTTPDSLIGCQDSFVNVAIRFSETYSDSETFRIFLDSILLDSVYTYNQGDTINTVIISVIGDDNPHLIQVIDMVDTSCYFNTTITTPLCYSPCNITIADIEVDSCSNELGYYSITLDSMTNSIGYQAYYDGDSIYTGDSLLIQTNQFADGLEHQIMLIDNIEPLCKDSMTFTAAYCLNCPLDISLIQRDSCEIEDSIGYSFAFNQLIDSTDVWIDNGDSTFLFTPADHDYAYDFRVRGDSSQYTFIFSSADDIFCTDTITVQTIDCTPIICAPDFTYEINGLTITFTDSSTTSESIIEQSWSINNLIQIGNLSTFNYTVDSIGLYEICHFIATDSCAQEICKDVLVGDPCTLITPLFTVTPITDGFQFTNMSTGMIDEYLYSFGDGIFSNSTDPFHVYAESGSYEACLRIKQSEFDCEEEYCQTIDVVLSSSDIENARIKIYPNPLSTRNQVNINIVGSEPLDKVDLQLLDIQGRSMSISSFRKLDSQNYTIQLDSELANGVYFLKINYEGVWVTKRVLVF